MSSYQYAYVMKELSKTYPGGRQILKNVWLSFLPGAKIGIIGVNGAGKSTLMKIIAGMDTEFTGEAWPAKDITVGYLSQEPDLDMSKNVFDNIVEGLKPIKSLVEEFEVLSAKFAEEMSPLEMDELIQRQGDLQEKIDAVDGWDINRRIEIAMDALRCPDGQESVKNLSGGEKRRVALCRLLMQHPDILLLDEPTNHLDAESVAWLERYLQEYTGTVILVTHDRYFLDNVVGWILEIDRGECFPFEVNYSSWLEQKQKRLAQESKQEDSKTKALSRELEWIRQSPKARQSKSKARVSAYEAMLAESQKQEITQAQISIPPGPRLGSFVMEVTDYSKGFGEKLLVDNLSFKMPPGSIVGVIGGNGAGKTTFMKCVTGNEKPDTGSLRIGDTVQLGYVDQSRDSLDDTQTVWEEISDGLDEIELGKNRIQSRAYCSRFNFRGPDQQKKIGQLSGGERNRVHLAKMLKSGANVLLLDEPTNDLDVETLRALEEGLENFAGSAIVISHDRWFLDRIATHILAFEGDSKAVWFEGNYADYEQDRKKRLGEAALNPKKVKYKPLAR